MSSPYSSALASRSPLIFFLFWLPRLLFSVFTQGCCWCSKQTTKYSRNPGPTPCPACAALLRHSLPPAFLPILVLRLLFSVVTEACSRPRRAQNVRPMIEYEMPPQPRPRHVPRAWHCFGKAYPLLFFLFWLCSCYFPCTEDAPGRGGVRHVNRVRCCSFTTDARLFFLFCLASRRGLGSPSRRHLLGCHH